MDEELSRRLDDIERRLAAIESHSPPPLPRPLAKPSGIDVLNAERVARQKELLEQMAAATTAVPVDTGMLPLKLGKLTLPPYASPPSPPQSRPGSVEQTIGLKWAGWIGAVVLVIGSAFGIEYAYDQGWFTGMPAGVRVVLLMAGGVLLAALGELIYRRVNRLAATGFFGAGIALWFMAGYVGHAWYGLYPQTAAVGLMLAAATAGLLIAARANQVSVAAVAILGGTITPALLQSSDFKTLPFLSYLLLLQLLAIGLCYWRRSPRWWSLRGLSLATTFLWMLAIISPDNGPAPMAQTTVFALCFAAIYQGELIWTTARRGAVPPGAPAVGVVFSLCVTAALTAWLMALMRSPVEPHTRGMVLVGLAGVTLLLGRVLGMGGEREALRALSRGFDTQAVLLLALAVPVALHGPAILFGWMLLSVGLAVLAVARRDSLSLALAVLVWGLSLACWLGGWTRGFDGHVVWLTVGGADVQADVVIAAAMCVCGHLLGGVCRLIGRPALPHAEANYALLSNLLDLAAAACLLGALLVSATQTFATVAGLGYGAVLLAAALLPGLDALTPIMAGVIGAVAVKWASLDILTTRLDPHWPGQVRPFWNQDMLLGLAIAGAVAVAGRAISRYQRDTDADADRRVDFWWAVTAGLACLLLAFTLGVESDASVLLRERAAALGGWSVTSLRSLWWTIIGAGSLAAWLLAVRPTLRTPLVRRQVADAARLLAFLLAAKFVFIDVMVGYSQGSRPTAALLLNAQVATAAVVTGLLLLTARVDAPADANPACGLAVLLILLVTGSAEIDRYAAGQSEAPAWIVRQVGWSIDWGATAVLTLILGFVLRRRPLRLAALALLAITLIKMTAVDLAGVGTGWRILSFLALGALLLATSVLYGKFRDGPAEPEAIAPPLSQ